MNGRDHLPSSAGSIISPYPLSGRRPSPIQGISAAALLIALLGMPCGVPVQAGEVSVTAADNRSLTRSAGPTVPSGIIPDDVAALLPLLMTSPERRQFAVDLETAIRLGKLEAAEHQLKAAIETGTLAIVLADRLRDPGLLTALQTLGIKGADNANSQPRDPGGSKADASCRMAAAPIAANMSELQEALELEQARGNAVAWELATLTDEFRNLQQERQADATATAAQVGELQEALRRARERSEIAQRELVSTGEKYSALKALHERETGSQASASSEMKDALARERERSETAMRELAAVKEKLQNVQKGQEADADSVKARIAELQTSLHQERERTEAAARDLAAAKGEARNLQALREREAAVEGARLSEMREALARERARGDAVTQELANAVDDLRAFQEIHESGPTPLMFRLTAGGAPSPAPSPMETRSDGAVLQVAMHVTGALSPAASGAAQNAATPEPQAPEPLPAVSSTAKVMSPPAVVAGRIEPAPPPAGAADDPLVRRADALLRSGDVSGARLLLERSLETGNARAAFLLAETFDPHVLSEIGVLGIRSDPARARELYARALALGIQQAGSRMQALK
jgi:hypothetical protein